MAAKGSVKLNDFARKQLEKYGWQQGDGLGKQRNGIREPIAVQKKNNLRGVGYNPHGDFDNDWWTKVYAKALNSVPTESNSESQSKGGSKSANQSSPLKNDNAQTDNAAAAVPESEQVVEDSEKRLRKQKRKLEKQKSHDSVVESEKQVEAAEPHTTKVKSYRGFVKRATLNGHVEQPVASNEAVDNDSLTGNQVDNQHTNTSSADIKKVAVEPIPDHVLLKACEYRTAHYGARHGALATGKLHRLAKQDEAIVLRR